MEEIFYVLFENHESGLKLYKLLRAANLSAQISPTPRSLSKCCGISLIVKEEELDQVRKVIAENDVTVIDIASVVKDINAKRDRYC